MGNVKHLANPLVKQAAQLVTKFANKNNEEARLAGLFYLCFKDIHCIVYIYYSFYNVYCGNVVQLFRKLYIL